MDHCALEKTIITTKLTLSDFGTVYELLARVLTPPDPDRITKSLAQLHRYGALTSPKEDATVTQIGHLTAHLPLELPLIRLLFFGHAFGRLTETIVMAGVLAQSDLFQMPARVFIRDSTKFATQVIDNLMDRVYLDAGRHSEAMAGPCRPVCPPPPLLARIVTNKEDSCPCVMGWLIDEGPVYIAGGAASATVGPAVVHA